MIRRAAACKHFGAAKILRWGGFTSPQHGFDWGPRATELGGAQGARAHQRTEGVSGGEAGVLRTEKETDADASVSFFCKECFALRRDPLLPPSAKVGKNAVQTCGLKIRSRPAQDDSLFCVPRAVDSMQTSLNVELLLRLSPLPLKVRNVGVRHSTALAIIKSRKSHRKAVAFVGAALRAANHQN